LLVDDEPDFVSALAERLRRRGFQAVVAADGEEALAIVAESEPLDAVVLDIRLPCLDGIAVLKRIKAELPDTEVILLTGHASAGSGIDGMRLGAFDYLTKPVELDDLVERLTAACGCCRSSRSSKA
ncbi:MAG: response regulator, partial [Pseudomonadota bacterium]